MKKISKILGYTISAIIFLILLYLVMRGIIVIPPDIKILGIRIRFYGLIIGSAIIISLMLVQKYSDIEEDILWGSLAWVMIPAIILARLWHVATDFHLYANNLSGIFEIWNGGLSIFGALLGGLIGGIIYLNKNKYPLDKTFGVVSVFLPLGHAIGRLANLVNNELYGPPTSLPWGVYIKESNRMEQYKESSYFHPAFLYEIIGNLILFALLYNLYKRNNQKASWNFVYIYIVGYGLIRFCVDFFRLEPRILLGLTPGQITSLFMIITGFIMFVIYKFKKNK